MTVKRTLNSVFAAYVTVKYDNALIKNIKLFRHNWSQKDNDYIEFLGNNLTGVQPIRFSSKDDEEFMELLGIDKDATKDLTSELYQVPGIDQKYKVPSNPIYLAIVNTMHNFIINTTLNDKVKNEVLTELYLIFAFKAFSSLLSHYFKFNANVELARATVERLTNKSLIKKLGSWQLVFEYRAKDVVIGGYHYKKLSILNAIDAVLIINDLQGKLRDILKNICDVYFNKVIAEDDTIKITKMTSVDEDKEEKYEGISDRKDKYIQIVKDCINIANDFIINDLVRLIAIQLKTISSIELTDVLTYISASKNHKDKDFIIESTILVSLEVLNNKRIENKYIEKADEVLLILKSQFTASNISNSNIKKVKQVTYNLIKKAMPRANTKLLNNMVNGVIMYIALRGLFK